ncbi:DUF6809 family protein [Intestinimonas sp.]|uniref:DUF6809 family protein n=1 Tax=Intestinimonas sp. TaxID=1965293 RepID=UPI00260E1E97|nr:DUF6809 family protein [Intestinimonas sp.]
MDNILDQLYAGKLSPFEVPRSPDQEYESAATRFELAWTALMADPDPERQRLLLQLEEEHERLLGLLERDAFSQGFRLGGQLVAEVFR